MAQRYPDWIWHNGAIMPWAEATTHVMSHALHYGSSVFEGIRSYSTSVNGQSNGAAIFRLSDHSRRLFASAKIYDMPIPYTVDDINAACRAVLKANNLAQGYREALDAVVGTRSLRMISSRAVQLIIRTVSVLVGA